MRGRSRTSPDSLPLPLCLPYPPSRHTPPATYRYGTVHAGNSCCKAGEGGGGGGVVGVVAPAAVRRPRPTLGAGGCRTPVSGAGDTSTVVERGRGRGPAAWQHSSVSHRSARGVCPPPHIHVQYVYLGEARVGSTRILFQMKNDAGGWAPSQALYGGDTIGRGQSQCHLLIGRVRPTQIPLMPYGMYVHRTVQYRVWCTAATHGWASWDKCPGECNPFVREA